MLLQHTQQAPARRNPGPGQEEDQPDVLHQVAGRPWNVSADPADPAVMPDHQGHQQWSAGQPEAEGRHAGQHDGKDSK